MKKIIISLVLCSLLVFAVHSHALEILNSETSPHESADVSYFANDSKTLMTYIYSFNQGRDLLSMNNIYSSFGNGESRINSPHINDKTSAKAFPDADENNVSDPLYLIIQDGNNTPWWYVFDSTDTGDNSANLKLADFWTGSCGDVSYIALYGNSKESHPAIPEPSTFMNLGAGIIGFAILVKRRIIKES